MKPMHYLVRCSSGHIWPGKEGDICPRCARNRWLIVACEVGILAIALGTWWHLLTR